MSHRERQARERVITAALAIAEVRSICGEMPDPDSDLMAEFQSAASALRDVLSTKGRVD